MKAPFVLAILLVCTISATPQIPTPEGKATVFIVAGWHGSTLWRAAFAIFCNDKMIARLDRAIYLKAQLAPGKYSFSTKNKKAGGVELDVKAGEVYYLKLQTDQGFQVTNPALSILPKEQGAFDLKQAKPIEPKDIKDCAIVEGCTKTASK